MEESKIIDGGRTKIRPRKRRRRRIILNPIEHTVIIRIIAILNFHHHPFYPFPKLRLASIKCHKMPIA